MAAFYLAENRRYLGYDRGLRTGPYQFTSPAQICALRFPYQDGLLVWLWDPFWEDNSVSLHPGRGLILPFDSHPVPLRTLAGDPADPVAPRRWPNSTTSAPTGIPPRRTPA
jgi:immune inhibitor A